MRTFGVVVNAPFLDNQLGFLETVEDFAVEAFIPEHWPVVPASLQATAIALPWACNTSIWQSFVTICSDADLFPAIFFLHSNSILSHRLVKKKLGSSPSVPQQIQRGQICGKIINSAAACLD